MTASDRDHTRWTPGFDDDDARLGDVLDDMPGIAAQEVSLLVRLFENPASPIGLVGSVSLERHDCIHILLGRGLTQQDEAFVLGYTMGSASRTPAWQRAMFKFACRYIYPREYRFSRDDLKVFDLAFEAANTHGILPIFEYPLEQHRDQTIGRLRARLGIEKSALRAVYRREQQLRPYSSTSARLPAMV